MLGKIALLLALLPLAGVALSMAFCWGHPLSALGPGVAIGGPLFCVPVSVRALRCASDRGFAIAALALGSAEVLLLVAILVLKVAA